MEPNNEKHPSNEIHQEHDDLTKIKYIGGHDYDGIRELDNPLPPWLKYLFYVTIVFAAAYLILLWAFDDDRLKQEKEYQKKMLVAEENRKVNEEATTDSTTDISAAPVINIEAGKVTYKRLCAVCHGQNGEGLVGPNFTDDYWIHGGSMEDMTQVVLTGVIEKGMISYKDQLTGKQIKEVLTFIISIRGTNPPNQKAPQGEKYVPPAGS